MATKIGILGSGIVGKTLAKGFHKYNYEVQIASSSEEKRRVLKEELGDGVSTGDFKETAAKADIVVLAVKGTIASEILQSVGSDALGNKIVIDATNPISDAPPVNGVLNFFTDMNYSLMEKLQKEHPKARFVKAFSCVGNAFMIDPDFKDGKPSMFIAGNDAPAKKAVTDILKQFGWEVEDMGAAEAARAIEPLCMLWCIPGFKDNQWNHAFKLIRA